jgi:hypothetical protein
MGLGQKLNQIQELQAVMLLKFYSIKINQNLLCNKRKPIKMTSQQNYKR